MHILPEFQRLTHWQTIQLCYENPSQFRCTPDRNLGHQYLEWVTQSYPSFEWLLHSSVGLHGCSCLFVWFYWSDNRWEIYHRGCVGDLEFNRLGRFLTLKLCQGQFQIGAGSKSRCQDFLDWKKKFRLPTMTSSDNLSYDQKGLVRIYSGTDCTKLRTGSK